MPLSNEVAAATNQALNTTSSPTFAKVNLPTGAAGSSGTGVLVAGTLTVSTTAVTANSRIMITRTTAGGTAGVGGLAVQTKSAGVSFVVNAVDLAGALVATDTSSFDWMLVN